MYKFTLRKLGFNDGSSFTPGAITVFVGPNNVGKSRALKDVVNFVTRTGPPSVLVQHVDFTLPASAAELRTAYGFEPYLEETGTSTFVSLRPDLCGANQWNIGVQSWDDFLRTLLSGSNSREQFGRQFGPALIAHLATEQRLQLVKEGASPSREAQRDSILQQMYYAGLGVESEIRNEVRRAFDEQEIILDYAVPQRLLLRVSRDPTQVPPDPRAARPILSSFPKLDNQGDGIRAFVGIVTALLTVKRDVILIDEPEAFLHPPQSLRMGEFLANHSGSRTPNFPKTRSSHPSKLARADKMGLARIP